MANRNIILQFIVYFAIVVLNVPYANAQEVLERPSPARLVNDFVGFLSPQEATTLETKLVTYANETSTQIAVVIIPSLNGYEIAQYSDELALKWAIGAKNKNNGLLILISKAERMATIRTGYGLEEKIPDITASRMIRNIITPAFKKEAYYEGLDACTTQIIGILKGEFVNENKDANNKETKAKPTRWLMWILIIVFILISILRRGSGGGILFFPFLFGGGGGYYSGGGYSDFNSGGSSFGGFGGGDFGGGGASGGW